MNKHSPKDDRRSSQVAQRVSAARLHQRSGASHAFGGYTKVQHNGTFRMRPTKK